MIIDSSGGAEGTRFLDLLQQAAKQPERLVFWWRDDDAETVTPQLERLLSLAGRHRLPLALAVVPKDADEALATRLAGEQRISVLQHGWQHRNHSSPGQKKMELGDNRPVSAVLDELRLGFDRLAALFPVRFLPVLVPPWNRLAPSVDARRQDAGLAGLSGFGPGSGRPHCVNTHIDIFDWHGTRGLLPPSRIYALLSGEIERRLAGDSEPIGLLTHHLIHRSESWRFLEEFLTLTAAHPAIDWRPLPALFALSPSR